MFQSCSKVVRPYIGKRKTVPRHLFPWHFFAFSWTGPLTEMLLIFTSENPLGYLHDMMLLGYVQAGLCNIYWCRLPYFSVVINCLLDGERRVEGDLPSESNLWIHYFAVNPTACLVQNRRHQLIPKPSKNSASKWLRSAAGKYKTSTMLPLFIEDKYRWNFTGSYFLPFVFSHFQFLPG